MIDRNKLLYIFRIIGSLFLIMGILLVISLLISVFRREGSSVYLGYLLPILLFLILGLLSRKIDLDNGNISISAGMVICSLGWFFVSLIAALPFYIILQISYLDALFETVSGFTTTGITVFTEISDMPLSVIFWRSFIQWLGGLGILTFFMFITFRSETEIWQLFSAEAHKFNTSRPVPNLFKSIRILWSIYILFTLAQTVILSLSGVGVFDALTHSFTTISTGGFSRFDSSIAYFQEIGHVNHIFIEYVIIFFMLMGGINFLVHYKVFTGDIKELIGDEEAKYFWKIILGTTAFILLIILLRDFSDLNFIEESFRKTLFQVVSVTTTTGYETEHIGSQFFPEMAQILFLMLMFIGGCVGSTAGGVKVIRITVLKKLLFREIKKFNLPKRAVFPITINGKPVEKKESLRVTAIVFGWIILIIIGGVLTSLFSHLDPFQSLSGMISAVSNIGPFYFTVAEMQELSPVIKITYIIGMLAGRLELIPVLILFRRATWK
ncbi:MAG: TrkH family potassium uptake protein [bacterium]